MLLGGHWTPFWKPLHWSFLTAQFAVHKPTMQFIIPKNINSGKKLLHHWIASVVIGLHHVFVCHDMDRYAG